jgi:AcrR family transcriptional regulator
MSRLAKGRVTHLSRDEIARATLQHFDSSKEPFSMRRLGQILGVAPGAVYKHFPSEARVIAAALGLVFDEVVEEVLSRGDPLSLDPVEAMVLAGVSMRRAFARHFRIAPYLVDFPESTPRLSGMLATVGAVFEGMGLGGERAGFAAYIYGNYVYGSIVFASVRRMAREREGGAEFSSVEHRPSDAPRVTEATIRSIDEVVAGAAVDTELDDRRFEEGLRLLLDSIMRRP